MKLFALVEILPDQPEVLPDQPEVVAVHLFKTNREAEKARDRVMDATDSNCEILEVSSALSYPEWNKDFTQYLKECRNENEEDDK